MFYYEFEGRSSLVSALRGLGIVLININGYDGLKSERYKEKKAFAGILGDGTEVAVEWDREVVTVTLYGVTDTCINQIKRDFRKKIIFSETREGNNVVLRFDIQALSKCIDAIPIAP